LPAWWSSVAPTDPWDAESVPSPWTALNTPLMNLATNICTMCSELTGAHDMFLASNHEVPKFTFTPRRPVRRRGDELLQSLYQLSESESCTPPAAQ
jgi:hypothetical protein